MTGLVFLKLGGSLLTDKTRPQALRPDVLARLASEIAAALAEQPDLRLLLGHGSGSYGHVTARQHGTRQGVHTPEQWRGFAEVGRVAADLNRLVVDALWQAGVPALRVQPSASALCHDGELRSLAERPLRIGLAHGLIPVVYGDVSLDEVRGGTIISTEEIFAYLAPILAPTRILLVGEVDGVLTADPATDAPGDLVDSITPQTAPALLQALGGSRGIDVTGGMAAKVREMLALVRAVPQLGAVQILSGLTPGLVRAALTDETLAAGTRITRSCP
jgi:isopentenyl phosphate kinase